MDEFGDFASSVEGDNVRFVVGDFEYFLNADAHGFAFNVDKKFLRSPTNAPDCFIAGGAQIGFRGTEYLG